VKFIRFAFIAGEDTQIFTIFKCEIMDMEKLISAVFVRGPLCDQKTKITVDFCHTNCVMKQQRNLKQHVGISKVKCY
jgi:hypothetical protein